MTEEVEIVTLKCIKEHGKLRIKVHNNPMYHPEVNCQFPRNLREEGQYFTIEGPLGIANTRGTIFYRASKKKTIKVVSSDEGVTDLIQNFDTTHIHQDEGYNDCVICMDREKTIIFTPCGHYYVCQECFSKLKKMSNL